jgi:HD superfamily phosphohydrolase
MKKAFSFYDNLYGYINVDNEFEEIIRNEFFTRLHNISQMGMTRYVFPDAVHTRYSHSLGVYHNIERMFMSQENQFDHLCFLNDKDKTKLKLTALLHDVGHVPLSHTTEQAMSQFYSDELQDDSLIGIPSQEKQYEDNGTKLHERLAETILLSPTSLNKALSNLGYSGIDISYGIMGFTREYVTNSGENADTDSNLYLKHARNFMHSQLDADRIDYLMRDAAFSGVKAGAFDVEKLLREIRYNEKANYGVDESGIRAIEQFFFARFGAYSQIVFNKKVHGLEYLAQDFYYRLLIEKKNGNIDIKFEKNILSFQEIKEELQNGNTGIFLSFVDSVFYELIERASDGSLFRETVPKMAKMARYLKNGTAPKVVGYEEYFATEEENKFHNSFFDHLRVEDNLLALSKTANVSIDEIILPRKPLSTKLTDKKKDLICVFKDNKIKHYSLLESDNSLLKLIQEKKLYLNRLFTFDEDSQSKLKKACVEMSKGFTYPGDF